MRIGLRVGLPLSTGGKGAVLQGPGCLSFSLILKISERAPLLTLRGTNEFIIKRHERALRDRHASAAWIFNF